MFCAVTMAFDGNLWAFVFAACQAGLEDKDSFAAFTSVFYLDNAKVFKP
jgi:hypothetical protein